MDEKYQEFLYLRVVENIKAAMRRAVDSRKKGFTHFAEIHMENALGAYSYWAAVAHGDYVKKHQNELLDLVYK